MLATRRVSACCHVRPDTRTARYLVCAEERTLNMKRLFIVAALMAASTLALGADVGVSVQVGQPGFYGRIDIGSFPPPVLVYPEPLIVQPVPVAVAPQPVYLHVPPGHAKNWRKHCRKYNACGQPVYFVQEDWYQNVYVPHYREGKGHGQGHGQEAGQAPEGALRPCRCVEANDHAQTRPAKRRAEPRASVCLTSAECAEAIARSEARLPRTESRRTARGPTCSPSSSFGTNCALRGWRR